MEALNNEVTMHKYKYIFLDCDGTAVDSEALAMPIASYFLIKIAREQGKDISAGYINGLFGKTVDDMMGLLERDHGVSFDSNVAEAIHQETVKILASKTKATEGMVDFIEKGYAQGSGFAIVTSSAIDRVLASLDCAGIKKFIPDNLIFSAVSTLSPPEPKPSGAIYEYALKKLGISHFEAIAYEDSVSGVMSAVNAGVAVIGYLGGSHLEGSRHEHGEKLISAGAAAAVHSWKEAECFLSACPLAGPDFFHKVTNQHRGNILPTIRNPRSLRL